MQYINFLRREQVLIVIKDGIAYCRLGCQGGVEPPAVRGVKEKEAAG